MNVDGTRDVWGFLAIRVREFRIVGSASPPVLSSVFDVAVPFAGDGFYAVVTFQ